MSLGKDEFLYRKNQKKVKYYLKIAQKKRIRKYRNKEKQRKIATQSPLSTNPRQNERMLYRYYQGLRTNLLETIIKDRENILEEKTYKMVGSFGLEGSEQEIANFIDLGKNTIDKNYKELQLDMGKCTRIWPSAITLLCSLLEWTEYNYKKGHCSTIPPRIRSSAPEDSKVDDYLEHCGFYKYVGRGKRRNIESEYGSIVKIQREESRQSQDERMCELFDLVRYHSTLNENQIEKFECYIMPDILLNVTEHGISCNDLGWWVLGQYHKTHKMISICVADNGIGIKNSLLTGPQKDSIESQLVKNIKEDSAYIELSFQESISGAHNAKKREKTFFTEKYNYGSNRGHGLPSIRINCIECGIRLAIFSHSSYIIYNEDGQIIKRDTLDSPLFAGTLYNLVIPAKGGET